MPTGGMLGPWTTHTTTHGERKPRASLPVEMPKQHRKAHWIAGAIKHPGALTKRAKRGHRSVGAEIRLDLKSKNEHVRKQAQLAKTLRKMHR